MLDQNTFEKVGALIERTANDVIRPYYQNLKEGDIGYKTSPHDPVSIADQKAEDALKEGLLDILPGSLFFGEESYSADKDTIKNILQNEQPVWIVDPIDGTRNFISGKGGFGIMCALYVAGRVEASWMYEVTESRFSIFKKDGGVEINGQSLPRFTAPDANNLLGRGGFAFLNKEHLDQIAREAPDINIAPAGMPSIMIYDRLLGSTLDFLIFKRTHAWDHVPGCAMVEALGGCAMNWSGKPYLENIQHITGGLIVARDKDTAQKILSDLITPMLALAEAS